MVGTAVGVGDGVDVLGTELDDNSIYLVSY